MIFYEILNFWEENNFRVIRESQEKGDHLYICLTKNQLCRKMEIFLQK